MNLYVSRLANLRRKKNVKKKKLNILQIQELHRLFLLWIPVIYFFHFLKFWNQFKRLQIIFYAIIPYTMGVFALSCEILICLCMLQWEQSITSARIRFHSSQIIYFASSHRNDEMLMHPQFNHTHQLNTMIAECHSG